MDRAAGEALDDNAFQEELLLVLVADCDGPGDSKARIDREFCSVYDPIGLEIRLLQPVFKDGLSTLLRFLRFFKNTNDNEIE
ncbi:hypothetical protein AAC387_Pa02g5200 [Persea americana]